jgi:hypothetical protein
MIVDSVPDGARERVPLLRVDDVYVYVAVLGEERRFSRLTGFEHPEGGRWSTWRLSGRDRRRFAVAVKLDTES